MPILHKEEPAASTLATYVISPAEIVRTDALRREPRKRITEEQAEEIHCGKEAAAWYRRARSATGRAARDV
jgi:hypothetical protein